MTLPKLGTATLEQTRTDPQLDDGDDERYSHFVKKDKIVASAVEGTPVTALCGKVWIPNRDPQKFPVCPKCKDMMDLLHSFDSGSDDPGSGT